MAESDDSDAADVLTRDGSLIGTPKFMAPEQLRGEGAVKASDQFAFCVALYGAVFGVPPFSFDSPSAALHAISRGPRDPKDSENQPLFAVLAKGLEARPTDRHASMKHLLEAIELAMRRRSRWPVSLAAGAMALLVGAGAWAASPDRCDGPQSALLETPVFEDFSEPLPAEDVSRFAKSWADGYQAACNRAELGDPGASRTLHCLEVVRIEFEDALSVSLANEFFQGLPAAPNRCHTSPEGLEPDAWLPLVKTQIEAARREMSGVYNLYSAGKVHEAADAFELVWPRFRAHPSPSVRTRALILQGHLRHAQGDLDGAVTSYEAGFDDATRLVLDTLALRAATALLFVYTEPRYNRAEAERWDEQARSLIGKSVSKNAQLRHLAVSVNLLIEEREFDAARVEAERGIRLARELHHDSPLVPVLQSKIAVVGLHQHDYRTARLYYELVLERNVRERGQDYPNNVVPLTGLVQVALAEGDYADAEALIDQMEALVLDVFGRESQRFNSVRRLQARLEVQRGNAEVAVEIAREVLASAQRAYGPTDVRLRPILREFSSSLSAAQNFLEAATVDQRILVVSEELDGADSYQVARSRADLALEQRHLGRLSEAEAGFRRALVDFDRLQGADSPMSAWVRSELGQTLMARGEFEEAIPYLERALLGLDEQTGDWALAAVALARALWTRGNRQDADRALTLAHQADLFFVESPGHRRHHEETSNWLATL